MQIYSLEALISQLAKQHGVDDTVVMAGAVALLHGLSAYHMAQFDENGSVVVTIKPSLATNTMTFRAGHVDSFDV
jgi:hypothetical protein